MSRDFAGLGVALATPFSAGGVLDLAAFQRLVRHVVEGGADVLIPLGTTGEAATLTETERDEVIRACLQESRGRPVVAGTGSNSTATACALTARARELGAHGALVVTPYYNKPTQAGIVAHFQAVAAAVPGFPLVAYNVPGRTGVNLLPATAALLWQNPQVVALKESSGNLQQIGDIARSLPPGRCLLAGDDALALPTIAVGGQGLVSVLGNLLPSAMKRLVDLAREGRLAEARALHARLLPAMEAVMSEPNPIPVKAGLQILGIGADHVRLPLTRAEPGTRQRLEAALAAAGDAR